MVQQRSWKARKVSIVGGGDVGATFAYALAQSGVDRIMDTSLPPDEQRSLEASAAVLRDAIVQLGR